MNTIVYPYFTPTKIFRLYVPVKNDIDDTIETIDTELNNVRFMHHLSYISEDKMCYFISFYPIPDIDYSNMSYLKKSSITDISELFSIEVYKDDTESTVDISYKLSEIISNIQNYVKDTWRTTLC